MLSIPDVDTFIGQSIKLVIDPMGHNKLCLVELQGKIEFNNSLSINNLSISMATLDLTSKDEPILLIGNQKLLGRKIILKKPIAVLSTTLKEISNVHNDTGTISHREMNVYSTIYEKYIFDTRPQTSFLA